MAKVLAYPGDTLAALVAEARWKSEEPEVPGVLEWIEQQAKAAEEAKFSAALRRDQDDVNYWTGYADALKDVLNAIQRREVRV